ncbi:hypothetical protein GOODEAATRI_005792, partial [Goodea atripinnis]
LRKTPTLQDLLQETEIKAESSCLHNTSRFSVSCSDVSNRTRDSLSPVPVMKVKNGIFLPPKTSTAYSAFFPSDMPPQQSDHEGYLTDLLDSQQGSHPCSFNAASHQSLSSGYVTCENQENTTAVSGEIDIRTTEEMDNVGGFFLHNTSDTIAKMPDIISHPPIDGEELERTGLESFFCSNIMGAKDVCSTSFHIDSERCGSLRAEQPELSHPHSLNKEVNIPFTARLDPARNSSTERNDGSLALSEENGLSDDPDLQQALNLTKQVHVQKTPSKAEAEPVDNQINIADLKVPEEFHPLSLQALLKKSQEYRRRQRMLRNQAKSTKIHQERTQEQPRARVEESSLSDKENDELYHKGTVTVEGKKTKEIRGSFIQSVEPSAQKSWEANIIQSEVTESKNVVEDEKIMESFSVEEETSLKNKLNSSQEFITIPKKTGVLIQQQPGSVKTPLIQGTFYETPCLTSYLGCVGKYRSVPVPNICLSPVPCKSKAVDAAGTSEPKFDSSSDFNEIRVKDLKQKPTPVPSAVNLTVEDNATSVFAKSSLHIDQLESNLCSLKVLISDLESTVKENLDDRRQPDSSMQSEESFESSKDSEQIENAGQDNSSGCLKDTQGADGDGNEVDELQQRQSFILFKKMDKDVGHEPRTYRRDDVSLTVRNRGSEIIKLSKQSQASATKRENRNEMSTEGGGNTNAQRGICKTEQLPSKSMMSVAQQMRIPSIFRNVTSKNFPPCHIADQGAHLKEREGNITTEAEGSVCSPSLNQSYDVDTPSDLWFQEGPGSDPGSQGSHGQEKHLTPESGSEDQVGVSKVKRRLLMHVTEGTLEKSDITSREVDSMARPNPGTPTAVKGFLTRRLLRTERVEQLVRTIRVYDAADELKSKVKQLAAAVQQANHLVVYTGAGISTVKHVVSQNCDGLHLRSGLPREALSELHGNMFIEVCTACSPAREFLRLFDVTERTSLHRHGTGRRCSHCGSELRDTIVHFGERGTLEQPLNWKGAAEAAKEADVILCLGSSLKADDLAVLKIHGKCDDVMSLLMEELGIQIPKYSRADDPIFNLATPLCPEEIQSHTREVLAAADGQEGPSAENEQPSEETSSLQGGWFGRGYSKGRRKKKRAA